MEYTCLYEAPSSRLITFPFIVILVIELIVITYSVINWKKNTISGKIGMVLVSTFLLGIIGATLYDHFSSNTIWKTYQNGEYQTAQGTIEKYTPAVDDSPSVPDTFTVDGKEFTISPAPFTGYGYTERQCDGGLLENGMECKIYYVPYKFENVIVELQIVQDD